MKIQIGILTAISANEPDSYHVISELETTNAGKIGYIEKGWVHHFHRLTDRELTREEYTDVQKILSELDNKKSSQ